MEDKRYKNNLNRFSGFSDCYDGNRPQAPKVIVEILKNYLGRSPEIVVDIGCGTGLSTFVWADAAGKVIGIEPNEDMISKARENLKSSKKKNIQFIKGLSNDIPLDKGTADIVTCSQSFHWMEPKSTILEAARILKKGGIFAAYDCDWPPAINSSLEKAYIKLMKDSNELFKNIKDQAAFVKKWDKEKHLENIQASNAFDYSKEIVFHNFEKCDAERFIGLALSQGHIQTLIKFSENEIKPMIEIFKNEVISVFNNRKSDILFSYRMRMAIK